MAELGSGKGCCLLNQPAKCGLLLLLPISGALYHGPMQRPDLIVSLGHFCITESTFPSRPTPNRICPVFKVSYSCLICSSSRYRISIMGQSSVNMLGWAGFVLHLGIKIPFVQLVSLTCAFLNVNGTGLPPDCIQTNPTDCWGSSLWLATSS